MASRAESSRPASRRSESRLYLLAPLPDDVGDTLAVSNDVEPMLPGLRLVSAARRHITLAMLETDGVPQDHAIQTARWMMATMPPFAFRVVFDELVSARRCTLLKASEPIAGALEAQAHILDTMRHYGLDLPRDAAPAPHVTLGYGHPATPGVRPIDGISWLVDELVLVRSWVGRTWHEELGRWRLPRRERAVA